MVPITDCKQVRILFLWYGFFASILNKRLQDTNKSTKDSHWWIILCLQLGVYCNASQLCRAALMDAIARMRLAWAVLKERIEAIQMLLDNALQRKAFAECRLLQETMDCLLSKRNEFFKIEELLLFGRNVTILQKHLCELAVSIWIWLRCDASI